MRLRRTVHLLGGPEGLGLQHLGVASLARGELGLRLGDASLGHLHLLRRVRVEPVPVLRAVVAAHLVEPRRDRARVIGLGLGLGLGSVVSGKGQG